MMLQTVCLLVCSLVFLNSTFIKSDPLGQFCPNSTLYSPNSTSGRIYRNNLDILLSVLTTNASRPNGFYSFSTGGAANSSNGTTIYGLFLCRGDVGTSDCEDCIKKASSEVLLFCQNVKAAVIWYDNCMLRFSNQSIFSKADDGVGIILINTKNATDKDLFGRVLKSTFDEVISNAVKDDIFSQKLSVAEENILTKKFAVGQNSVPSMKMTVASGNHSTVPVLPQIYTLAQCTPDISSLDCRACLENIRQSLPDYYPQGGRAIVPSCIIWYETYLFFNISSAPLSPQPSGVPPPTPLSPQPSGKGVSTRVVMVIVFSIASCTMLLIICFLVLRKRSKKRRSTADRRKSKSGGDDITIDPESLQYSLSEIETATKNFSAENKIGQGGFGIVYKGKLSNGQEIAVKRLSKRSGQGAEEFKNEITVVAKLQHRNLVQLLGFCLEGEEKILVFEFVPRRSLDYFLFDPKKQGLLNWSRRRNIIGGIARGLLYLHEDSRLKIVHRDLKAGNILLDKSMHPKIADFGMAKICGIHESEGDTTRIAGTLGYMAPEYTRRGHYSVKSDVFSFGVVILEILTGKKNSTFYHSADSEDLITYAWRQWRNGTPLALLDPTIEQSCIKTEVIQCVHIGLLCVEEDANKRPTMASVVYMLNSTSVSLPTPHCPAVLEGSKSGNHQEELEYDEANAEVNLYINKQGFNHRTIPKIELAY